MEKPNILYEDKQILVVEKEAGMAVQSAGIGQPDMESRIKAWLSQTSKERVPYLGIVHRLDQPVEGLVVFGRTKEAAAALSRQLAKNTVKKSYLAVVEKELAPGEEKTLEDFLKKERQQAVVCSPSEANAKKAVLAYRVIAAMPEKSLLLIQLKTGRFHQIRCQLSHQGMPIAGDVRYGGSRMLQQQNIALCAWQLEFDHPKNGKRLKFMHCHSGEAFISFEEVISRLCDTENGVM